MEDAQSIPSLEKVRHHPLGHRPTSTLLFQFGPLTLIELGNSDSLPYVNGSTICTPVNYSSVRHLNLEPTEWHMCIVSALYHSTTQDCYKLAVRWYIYSCVYPEAVQKV